MTAKRKSAGTKKPTPLSAGRHYWVVANKLFLADQMTLEQFLVDCGYATKPHEDSREDVDVIDNGIVAGLIRPGENVVRYNGGNGMSTTHASVKAGLRLRRIFDVNRVPYREYPAIGSVENRLNNQTRDLVRRLKRE